MSHYAIKNKRMLLIACILMLLLVVSASAEEGDRYAPDAQSQTIPSPSKIKPILDAPAVGVRVLKKGIKDTVVWIEDYRLIKKTRYVYQEITDRGFYPVFTDIGVRHNNPPGIESTYGVYAPHHGVASCYGMSALSLQYKRTFMMPTNICGKTIDVNSWVKNGYSRDNDYGAQIKLNDFLLSNMYFVSTVRYQDSHTEDFYGTGPNRSIADGARFSLEEYSATAALGYELPWNSTIEVGGVLSSVDVSNGFDSDKKNIVEFGNMVDGVSGASLCGIGLSLEHDTRDNDLDPHGGGYERIKASLYDGIDGDKYGYTKLQVNAARYFPIGKYLPFLYYDSVIALRVAGETNNEVNDDKIPFYDLARLGGVDTIRGHEGNRFFGNNSLLGSIEYRYNLLETKYIKVNASLFFDCGWIADEISEFEFSEYKEGYGIGLRIIGKGLTVVCEAAHSDEATEFYVTIKPIF